MTNSDWTPPLAGTDATAVAPSGRAGATAQTVKPESLTPEFWRLVRSRRSIRRYLPLPVTKETVLALLEAARWAPSAHNRQPWRFCVITTPAAKEELSRRMSEYWRQDLSADGMDDLDIARRIAISHARLTTSPVLIVPALTMEDMDVYSDVGRNHAEYIMGVQSVALACQNLLLAAHDAGLAASWLCAPLFAPELVRSVLVMPDHWHPQAILTLGYAAEHKEKDRAPLAAQVVWR